VLLVTLVMYIVWSIPSYHEHACARGAHLVGPTNFDTRLGILVCSVVKAPRLYSRWESPSSFEEAR